MCRLADDIVEKLWAAHRAGKRPVAVRMAHRTLTQEFIDRIDVDADENGWLFQTLPVRIDSWHQSPFIECEVVK